MALSKAVADETWELREGERLGDCETVAKILRARGHEEYVDKKALSMKCRGVLPEVLEHLEKRFVRIDVGKRGVSLCL